MVKPLKMRIKHVGPTTAFFLLFCSLLGMAMEDKKVIKGLISGFHLNSPSEELDEKLVEVLAVNCRIELIYLKQIYENLGFNIPDPPPTTSTGKVHNDQALTVENVKKALSILLPQIRENLFKCLRENYLITPVSGEDVTPASWFQKHLESLFPKANTATDSRRHLAEASGPAPAPAPTRVGPKRSDRKPEAPPPPDTLFIHIPVPESSPAKDNDSGHNTHKKIVVAVVVTTVVTFFFATILFCCCRKVFGGRSRFDHKDDRPLLSLSMSDYSVSGSSPKAWAFDNPVHKETISNQSYVSNLSGKEGSVSLDGKLSSGSTGIVAANVAALESRADSSFVSTSTLKPPPGRTGVSGPGLPPLKPPPGRADPLPPEPRASLRPRPSMASPPRPPPKPPSSSPPPPPPKPPASSPPPPPPPKPPASPPPPPPAKRPGPPPPGPPPPPPGKPGPRAPPPPKSGAPRPPPAALKVGSSSSDADDNAAKAKLKPFFWDKVMANPDHSMVWHQIKSGSFQFNEEMIESLFGYAAAENKNEKKESSSRDPPAQYIQLIDQKKAQNLSILLRALNVTTEEVRDALLEGNELPSELLETLLKMAPTAEEELKLRLFSGALSQLGPAERFLKILVDIPFAFRRLEALLFMGTLHEEATTVKESFITLEAACKELRNSRLFLKLLEAVLKTGNRMNDGTFRGGAQAFKLDTLLKLADVKGTDGKTTLLHFVVQEIIRSEGIRAVRAARDSKSISSIKSEDLLQLEDTPEDSEQHYRSLGLQVVSGLGEQLENVRKAASLDADSFTGSISKLGTSLVKTKNFLNEEMEEVNEENGFHQGLKSFVDHTEGDIMWLLEEEKRIMALVKSTADYFHGNSGKEEGLRLFVIVRDFLIMLEKVCREVKERPKWPTRTQKKDPPSRQTSSETPRTTFTPDFHQRLFPAIAQRRMDGSSSDDD